MQRSGERTVSAMSKIDQLAEFVHQSGYQALSEDNRQILKTHILDTLGCAIGAVAAEPLVRCRRVVDEVGGNEQCTLIGGGRTSLPLTAFYNGALVRYLDFMDTFLAATGECHPCDNFGSLLAAAEYAGKSGRELLGALAVSYQIIAAISAGTKIMKQGFDHTTSLTFSIAAGVSKLLDLDIAATANALALAGGDAAGPMANRTEPISNFKGLATAAAAYRTTFAVLLAREGITGPHELFEGPGGLEQMTNDPWDVDWASQKLDVLPKVMIKKYNGEARSQSAIDAVLALRAEHDVHPESIAHVRIDTFRTAYDNLGGGKFGPKDEVHTKEQADHNLKYMAAVALLDGDLWPEQYDPDRLKRPDVQSLMHKVYVEPKLTYTWQDPQRQPTRVTITLTSDQEIRREQNDYEGFPTRPMSWDRVAEKFERLAAPYADRQVRRDMIDCVARLESADASDLTALLAQVRAKPRSATLAVG